MNLRRVASIILVQCALLGFLGAKYLYDRHAYPRVWTTATLYDPDALFRGRYLALQINADGCSLPESSVSPAMVLDSTGSPTHSPTRYRNSAVRLHVVNGKLVATDAENLLPHSLNQRAFLNTDVPCTQATIGHADYFVPDSFKLGQVMKEGDTLWVEVTVPPVGTPRPIQLAVNHNGVFTPLHIR